MDSNLIPAKLIELHTAINDKTGKQCYQPYLHIKPSDNNAFSLMYRNTESFDGGEHFQGNDLDILFVEAFDHIAALPSVAEQNQAEFQGKLAALIDMGLDYNIDADFINPLIAASKKLAENAITHHKDFATDEEMHDPWVKS